MSKQRFFGKNDKTEFYQLTIVAIVAIVGIVIMISFAEPSHNIAPTATYASESSALAGQALREPYEMAEMEWPYPLTPESAATQIVHKGYELVDQYIRAHPEYEDSYPGGQLTFYLANSVRVHISPAFAMGHTWRTITFSYPDNTFQSVFLDGPIFEEPGTPNPDAIDSAIEELDTQLVDSDMKIQFWNRKQRDLDTFITFMESSIDIEKDYAGEIYWPDEPID